MVTTPDFWWRPRPTAGALALWPASRFWGAVTSRRMRRAPDYWAPVPVLCVGNFTAGGEGKTPTAIALGRLAGEEGFRPGFLSRGHGGRERGPLLVEPERHRAVDVGDEPLLLARIGDTVVSRDRPAGARLLAERGADLIIMDDGFQNPHLGKDVALVALDATTGLGNRMVHPAGPLRAPLMVQLERTDALVAIGDGAPEALVQLAARAGAELLRARLVPDRAVDWEGRPVLAFAGIGRPDKFFAALEAAGAGIARRIAYADHHLYTEAEAKSLIHQAESEDLRLVTTEKDMARLQGTAGALAELLRKSQALTVWLTFERPDLVRAIIRAAVAHVHAGRPAPSASIR